MCQFIEIIWTICGCVENNYIKARGKKLKIPTLLPPPLIMVKNKPAIFTKSKIGK